MSSDRLAGQTDPAQPEPVVADEVSLTRWQKFRLVVKVVELRLRFIALMAITALMFAYWDTIWNRYDKWMRPIAGRHAAVSSVEYYCPMHPQVIQDAPGSCPICGMPLARRKKGEKVTLPPGVTARVHLEPFQVRQAGIETAEVGYAPLTQTLTTVGYVAFDERLIANIVSKVPGKTRVEKLYINFTGQDVKAGEPVAELYSPELFQTVQELLTAAQRVDKGSSRVETSAGRAMLGDRREMVRLTVEKLKKWGITQDQINEILKTRKSDFTVAILSPISGHVFKKNVVEGQEVQEGFAMFEVADLHRVWIQAQVYENQIGLVHVGQPVDATVESFPGKIFPGKVEFVQPHLDPATRTVEVRFALDNPGHRLRPGMFAAVTLRTPIAETLALPTKVGAAPKTEKEDHRVSLTVEEQKTCPVTKAKLGSMGKPILVEVEGRKIWTCCSACPPKLKAEPAKYLPRLEGPPRGEVLSIPESAVIDTGTRKIVYVEAEPGVFEGREVVLGPRVGNRFPVIEGLAHGEKVAVAGAFLIDAESKINPSTAPAGPAENAQPKESVAPPRTAAVSAHSGDATLSRTEAQP